MQCVGFDGESEDPSHPIPLKSEFDKSMCDIPELWMRMVSW